MPILNKGTDFATNDQVTSAKLDNLVDAADFTNTSGTAVDSSGTTGTCVSDGGLEVTDPGGQLQIASNGVTTAKILDSNVTKAKIENVADMKVLGNTSGSAAAPQEVTINDTDDMSDASATTLATSESIKAYVDSNVGAAQTAIYRTVRARSASIGSNTYWQAWTELYDPAGLGAWTDIYYKFANTGTYLVEATLLIEDNNNLADNNYYPQMHIYDGSTVGTAFYSTANNGANPGSYGIEVKDATFEEYSVFQTHSHPLSFVLRVADTTDAQIAISTVRLGGAVAVGWEGAGTFKVTKLSDSLI